MQQAFGAMAVSVMNGMDVLAMRMQQLSMQVPPAPPTPPVEVNEELLRRMQAAQRQQQAAAEEETPWVAINTPPTPASLGIPASTTGSN
eukprot:6922171-Alexandrium_andersonii.AAC.1